MTDALLWDLRLRQAGWLPGDVYQPEVEGTKLRTKNLRLQLWNSGLWSRLLVSKITEGRVLSRYRRRKPPKHTTPHRAAIDGITRSSANR